MHDNIDKIAREFARLVREELADELPEILRRNENYDSCVCATHDFCDANILMSDAFESVMGRNILPDEGEPTESDCDLWNQAWAEAKKARFWSEESQDV